MLREPRIIFFMKNIKAETYILRLGILSHSQNQSGYSIIISTFLFFFSSGTGLCKSYNPRLEVKWQQSKEKEEKRWLLHQIQLIYSFTVLEKVFYINFIEIHHNFATLGHIFCNNSRTKRGEEVSQPRITGLAENIKTNSVKMKFGVF